MSPRAAWRLEALGFPEVYDYRPGKMDWAANGLPLEGRIEGEPSIGDLAIRDVPTCAPDERIGPVRERVRPSGWRLCPVVNEERVVLGLLRAKVLASDDDPDARVEDVMSAGPSTWRPYVTAHEMAHYMADHDITGTLVTTSEGKLVGYVRREDVEPALGEERREAG